MPTIVIRGVTFTARPLQLFLQVDGRDSKNVCPNLIYDDDIDIALFWTVLSMVVLFTVFPQLGCDRAVAIFVQIFVPK